MYSKIRIYKLKNELTENLEKRQRPPAPKIRLADWLRRFSFPIRKNRRQSGH